MSSTRVTRVSDVSVGDRIELNYEEGFIAVVSIDEAYPGITNLRHLTLADGTTVSLFPEAWLYVEV